MSEKARRFFSAESIERAVLDAASYFGVTPEELRYEPVEKRGLARHKVAIRVDPEAPVAEDRPPAPEKREEAPIPEAAAVPEAARVSEVEQANVAPPEPEPEPLRAEAEPVRERGPAPGGAVVAPEADRAPVVSSGVEGDPAAGRPASMEIRFPANAKEWFDLLPDADVEERVAAERWTTALLDLAGLELTPRVRQGEEQLEVHLTGADAEWLADDDGEVLLSMQHLLPRLMQSDLERLVSCRVDCGGFQLLREERLRARAHWAAEEVRSEGRAVTLEPMSPADRRIIHLSLVHDATVDTESLGRGFFKRVSVRAS